MSNEVPETPETAPVEKLEVTILTPEEDAALYEEYLVSGAGNDYLSWRSGKCEFPRVLVQGVVSEG